MKTLQTLSLVLVLILTLNLTSAVIINSVFADTFSPGQEGQIRIEIENILNDDVEDVSLTLNFQNLPFIPLGTSEQSIDEIDEDDEEDFVFMVKAAQNIEPDDYEIPYILEYEINNEKKTKTGTIGVKVKANPDLVFTPNTENAVIGKQGKIILKIINKGFYDARFVSVRVLSEGYTLLSEDEVYIGEIESDDFETATFDVVFNSINSELNAVVEYIDFDNQKATENINLPLKVYTPEKARQLGIIQTNSTLLYLALLITLVLLIILWRTFRRLRRQQKSMQARNQKS